MRSDGGPWGWLAARPRRSLAVGLLLTCALRAPFVGVPLGDDEGGYLYVAQHWSGAGHWLYGAQWVDRPPFLILVFRLVAVLGSSPVAMRLVAMAFAALLVVGAWAAGRRLAGGDGAAAAGLVAAALASDPMILGSELNSDGIGAALGMASFAALLAAVSRRRARGSVLAALAGLLGALAFLSKQSAVLALVMGVLVLAYRWRDRRRLGASYALGTLVPLAATLVWAATGPGLGMLVNALWSFRVGSAEVVAASASRAPQERFWSFLQVMVVSGVALPIAYVVLEVVRRRQERSVRVGLAVALGVVVSVIVASLNWYPYYLLAAVPLAAVGMALAVARRERRAPPPWLPRLVVLVTVGLVVTSVVHQLPARLSEPRTSRFVAAAAAPGDSMIVVWGQPNLMEDAGLTTPYPYSWALPVRVEDPHLTLFRRTLTGRRAPTWLLQVGSFGEWGLGSARVRQTVAQRFHVVATVCGDHVWLRDGTSRSLQRARQAAERGTC